MNLKFNHYQATRGRVAQICYTRPEWECRVGVEVQFFGFHWHNPIASYRGWQATECSSGQCLDTFHSYGDDILIKRPILLNTFHLSLVVTTTAPVTLANELLELLNVLS